MTTDINDNEDNNEDDNEYNNDTTAICYHDNDN